MLDNNPLKQYFRRPSIYFKLPSGGKYYSSDVVTLPPNNELAVYPMSAVDEITIRTPDGLFNGAAIVSLIKSCFPEIIDPWKINTVDLEAVMIAMKAANNDGVMNITSACPNCGESSDYDINLMPILSSIKNVNYDQLLTVNALQIKFKPLTYAESNDSGVRQFTIQKTIAELGNYEENEEKNTRLTEMLKQLQSMIFDVVASTIEYIQTPETKVTDKDFIIDFLKNCDKPTNDIIKNYSIALKQQSEIQPIDIKCPHCQHEYKQPIVLNATDFFD